MTERNGKFKDRVVWITGSSSGMGEATARLFAAAGATLVLSDINAERVNAVARSIRELGGEAHALAGDLRDPETSRHVGAFIAERFGGRLDMLVNAAGFNIPDRKWEQLRAESLDAVIGVNLLAPFYCATVALPLMRARKSGLLVHIASTDGLRVGVVGGPAYTASKHGLVAMSQSINLEEARNGIRSSVVCPGGVDTGFLDHRASPPPPETRARYLRPGDVADVIAYIAGTPANVRLDQVVVTQVL